MAFQSTPVSEDGRTTWGQLIGLRPGMFQSTPVSEDGRTPGQANNAELILFQSTPVSEDGRTRPLFGRAAQLVVSIHARQ